MAKGRGDGKPDRSDGARGSRDVTPSLSRRLRTARQERGLSLEAVAQKAQISASLLSQIERGKASPSLVSLVAIADALMLRPGDLLDETADETADSPVVRHSERHVIEDAGCRFEYMMHLDDPMLEVAEMLLQPDTASRPHLASHTGRDYGIVLEGTVRVEFEAGSEDLGVGDYIAFDSDAPHRLLNPSDKVARVIWIIAHEGSPRGGRKVQRRGGKAKASNRSSQRRGGVGSGIAAE
jgi:transcriptional regulator with XRE-family HTH domain